MREQTIRGFIRSCYRHGQDGDVTVLDDVLYDLGDQNCVTWAELKKMAKKEGFTLNTRLYSHSGPTGFEVKGRF